MTKFRLNLRRVAIVFACLAVTMMFAACDNKKGDDDENGDGNGDGGKIDTKLVGTWELMEIWNWGGYNYTYYYHFTFDKDGSFVYGDSRANRNASGKYSTANGKITFTDISYKYNEDAPVSYTNKVFEYKIESSDGKPLLRIEYFHLIENEDGDYFGLGESGGRQFRWKE